MKAAAVFSLTLLTQLGCSKKEILIGWPCDGLRARCRVASPASTASTCFRRVTVSLGGLDPGRPVRLVFADDQWDQLACAQADAAFYQAGKRRLLAVLGPVESWLACPGRICQQAKVSLVATTASDPLNHPGGRLRLPRLLHGQQQGEAGARVPAFESLEAKQTSCLFQQDWVPLVHREPENFCQSLPWGRGQGGDLKVSFAG